MPVAAFYNRPDINHVLVADLAPSQVCLAWDSSLHSALIREYVAIEGYAKPFSRMACR
jgi:hypothetical protein